MSSRIKLMIKIVTIVLLLAFTFTVVHGGDSSANYTNSIRLNQVILPPGSYTIKLQWGPLQVEKSVQLNDSPADIELSVPAVVNRSEIIIEIWNDDKRMFHILLAPCELGYDIIEYNAFASFVNTSQAIIVREVVFLANATIVTRPSLGSVEEVESMMINQRPLVPVLHEGKLVTPVFIVDKVVDLALKLKNGSIILTRFSKIGEKGLSVVANFEGDLEEVKVHYSYGINVVSWVISVPSTLRNETTQLYYEEGLISAVKGQSIETEASPQTSLSTSPQGENPLENLLVRLKDLRFYLLLLSLIIGTALYFINRKVGMLIILIGSLFALIISLASG